MKWKATYLLIAIFSVLKCSAYELLSARQFQRLLISGKKFKLIDTRTPEAFEKGFIKGAVNLDWYNNFEDYIQQIDSTEIILFYSESDQQAEAVGKLFDYKRYRNVYALKGGTAAWKNAGYTLLIPRKAFNSGISLTEYGKIIRSKHLVVVDFNAPWCKPCRILSPILDSLAEIYQPVLSLRKIDIDQNRTLAKTLNVISLPLILLYRDGKEVWRKNEMTTAEQLSAVISSFQK